MSLLASTLCFVGLHLAVARLTLQPFGAVFRLARGLASVVLSALGFFALVHFGAHWQTVYVLQAQDPLATALVMVPTGHFIADFALLAYGSFSARAAPRTDLMLHHALGLVAAMLTLRFPIAAPLYLVLFTTELMPITSALSALGALRADVRLQRLGARLRLIVLLAWRIPLWLWVGAQTALVLHKGGLSREARVVYAFSSFFLLITLSLDAYWTALSLRALREGRRA